ncbi:hypothetical protein [Lactococcus termiticola]|uniref:Lipoprotein n=1 Tax=Lactococcus termiticola TaxID=2169526 RepID=A0A2R5HD56_9LACT|nr:hypothetical protein [Lactococcus termiticola]GBG95952.1 hypothetical protein NtB2_00054 [Lactococcus termiticola]
MKQRKWGLLMLSGVVLLSLSACGRSGLNVSQPSVSSQTTQNSKESVTAQSQAKPPATSFSISQELDFVQKFLTAYTTYTSLNAQKSAIKPFLTSSMQKQLAVGTPASRETNQVMSVGQNLSVWQNDKGEWLGLVTVKINDQTSSVQVFLVGLEIKNQKLLVSQLSSPTQE